MLTPTSIDEDEVLGEDGVLNGARGFGVVVVEAEFAPRDALGVEDDAAEVVPNVGGVGAFVGVQRVDTGGTPDVRMSVREGECIEAVVGGGGNGDESGDASGDAVGEDAGDVGAEFGEGEMAVGVDHMGG